MEAALAPRPFIYIHTNTGMENGSFILLNMIALLSVKGFFTVFFCIAFMFILWRPPDMTRGQNDTGSFSVLSRGPTCNRATIAHQMDASWKP